MAAKRGNYSSPRQRARQERILACAREVIADKGYDGLTMRDLARVSGVSDKTLYNLFESKDRLVMHAVADLLDVIVQRVEAEGGQPGLETVLQYLDAMSRQILATPAYAEAMARGLFRSEPDSPLVDVLLRSNDRFLSRELYRAQRRGELQDDLDIPELARLLVGHMWGVLLLWDKGLLELPALPESSMRSLCMCLASVARGPGKKLVNRRAAATV